MSVQQDTTVRPSAAPEEMAERGVILYNRGTKCLVRMLVCLYSLRKWWSGPVTAFLEGPHPSEFEESLRELDVDIRVSSNPAAGAYIRKVEVCLESSYRRSLWLDSDTIVCGPLDEVFAALDDHEVVTPHFAEWWSHGRRISRRILQYQGKCPDEWLKDALAPHPAVNMGVFAFRQDSAFLAPWLALSRLGDHGAVFLPEEIAFQILYPRYQVGILPRKFGVSVKHDPGTEDIRVVHYHGQKHVHPFPLCAHWKRHFHEMLECGITRLPELLHLADRRLRRHLGVVDQVTLVTACDPRHVEKLRITFPNWVTWKRANCYPVLVFVNGMPLDDPRLNFLRRPNVRLVEWELDVPSQREKMLSAFVLGAAQFVETKWWAKLDADAYATDDRPLLTEEMKRYAIYGHRWGRSIAEHIRALDAWAAGHRRLRTPPLFDPRRVRGDHYMHARTASYIQLQSSRFTRFCAKLAGPRLPVPSHDTYFCYVADRLGFAVGRTNFKKAHGFTNCSGLKRLRERVRA